MSHPAVHTIVPHMAEGHAYSPQRCHEYATDLFGAAPMARAYAALYVIDDALRGDIPRMRAFLEKAAK